MSLIGNRTVIVALCTWATTAAARYGIGIDPTILADVVINGFPIVMVLMRSITRTPMGKST